AGLEVDAGAAFLVHDAHLDGVGRQPEELLDAAEDHAGEGDLVGAVHLRLDDVDRAGAGVAARLQVVDGDQRRADGIQDAFGHFVAVPVEDGGVGHQVADVAHEHQRAAMQAGRGAVAARVFAVRVQAAGDGPAALDQVFGQVALHQAQPVAVGQDLVVRVHGGDGVLAVHDGGQGRFDDHVLDVGRIGLADGVAGVELD